MGELSWDSFEPSQGKFEFDRFDKIMDRMQASGIRMILDIPGLPAPMLMRRADTALYRAKSRGRNCFHTFAAELEESLPEEEQEQGDEDAIVPKVRWDSSGIGTRANTSSASLGSQFANRQSSAGRQYGTSAPARVLRFRRKR
jgi:hypothetical protein